MRLIAFMPKPRSTENDAGSLLIETVESSLDGLKDAMSELTSYYLLNNQDTSAATGLAIKFEEIKEDVRKVHATHEKGQKS